MVLILEKVRLTWMVVMSWSSVGEGEGARRGMAFSSRKKRESARYPHSWPFLFSSQTHGQVGDWPFMGKDFPDRANGCKRENA